MMKDGLKLETRVSTLLNWVDPKKEVAWMASEMEDRLHATDMWVRSHPVQLTTISNPMTLKAKATIAFQSMPNTGASRWVVSAPPHISTDALLQVIKKIARDNTPGDRILTLH